MFPDDGTQAWTIPLGWTADNVGRCRSCGAAVMWCLTLAGKKAPVNPDGTSHFSSCNDPERWRKRR